MLLRPTSSTRTYTLFPYTTLFRSLMLRQARHEESLNRILALSLSKGEPIGQPASRTALRKARVRSLRGLVSSSSAGPCSAMRPLRSEEHTSELQSLMRISYAVFCLNKKNETHIIIDNVIVVF